MSDARSSQFCPRCDVHMSLHPNGDESPEDCRAADMKASSLERIGRVLIPAAYDGGGSDE